MILIPPELLSFCNIEFFSFTAVEIKNRLKLLMVLLLLLLLLASQSSLEMCVYIFNLNKCVTPSGPQSTTGMCLQQPTDSVHSFLLVSLRLGNKLCDQAHCWRLHIDLHLWIISTMATTWITVIENEHPLEPGQIYNIFRSSIWVITRAALYMYIKMFYLYIHVFSVKVEVIYVQYKNP